MKRCLILIATLLSGCAYLPFEDMPVDEEVFRYQYQWCAIKTAYELPGMLILEPGENLRESCTHFAKVLSSYCPDGMICRLDVTHAEMLKEYHDSYVDPQAWLDSQETDY